MFVSYVVGVAAGWSLPDLRLLDAIVASERGRDVIRRGGIAVFDMGGARCRSDLERIIPGLGKVYQSPVVGFWKMGGLIASRWGHDARRFLIDEFHLSVDLFAPAPTAAPLASS